MASGPGQADSSIRRLETHALRPFTLHVERQSIGFSVTEITPAMVASECLTKLNERCAHPRR